MMAPWGTYTNPTRLAGAAAVFFSSVCAGTIESSSGNARVTPIPRRNVRRGRCFLVRNIALLCLPVKLPRLNVSYIYAGLKPERTLLFVLCRVGRYVVAIRHPAHLKRRAFDDRGYQRRESIVVRGGILDDAAHHRHIVGFESLSELVNHELFRNRSG